MRRQIILAALAALAPAAPGAAQQRPEGCPTAGACIERLLQPGPRPDYEAREAVEKRLRSFGAEAVDALVPLLRHEEAGVRAAAGMALGRFERIDPRHLPALIAAYEAGDGWLPRPIAATGSDEALAFLIRAFLADPRSGSNSQVTMALARFGDRLRPFAEAQFEICRTGGDIILCDGVVDVLEEMPAFPAWALESLVAVARSETASAQVRNRAEYTLIRNRHPHGLAALTRDLEEARRLLSGPAEGPVSDSRVALGVRDVGTYGAAAREAVPLLSWFLAARDLPDTRAAAALALGSIGDRSAAAMLVGLEPAFADDWLLAYNVVESLGRLRIAEARALIARAASGHWYAPVRNNAGRALNALAGGDFARPGVPNDGAPYEQSDDPDEGTIIYAGDLRYRGDRDLPLWCAPERAAAVALRQNPVGAIPWPRAGARSLSPRAPDGAEAQRLRVGRPALEPRARITLVVPTPGGVLIGEKRGDWGGALFHFDAQGGARVLVRDNVSFAFRLGGRLYVVTGDSHALMSDGAVWEIDPEALRVVRRIRLPAEARRAFATSGRALVLATREGALAILENGSLADPAALGRYAVPAPSSGSSAEC